MMLIYTDRGGITRNSVLVLILPFSPSHLFRLYLLEYL